MPVAKTTDPPVIENIEKIEGLLTELISTGESLVIALMDIDHFTNINMKIGYKEGNDILYRLYSFLTTDNDFKVKRYGGDEFILFFPGETEDDVYSKLDRLKKEIRKQKFFNPLSNYANVPITVSIGIAGRRRGNDETKSWLKSVEIAMGMAKKQGRNRVARAPESGITIRNKPAYRVTTVIGGELRGCGGDGQPAFSAQILEPYGVDLTEKGELLIADRGNHRIRQIETDGTIRTIAGADTHGYTGDNGQAVGATLNKPSGIAVDNKNQIYIADTGNHCLRMVDNQGRITTYAGCGQNGYSGDGGPATQARLSRPGGVVVDDHGCVYTNDYGNNVIRKIDNDGIISTIAGSGAFGFSGDGGNAKEAAIDKPYGLGVTKDGCRLYIADYGNHCIREVNLETGRIRTICGIGKPGYSGDGGIATKAALNGPFWVYPMKRNYLLIADAENHCIRMINLATNIVQTVVGNGKPGFTDGSRLDANILLNIPAGMIFNDCDRSLYIADYGNNAIRRVTLDSLY